MCSKPKWQLVVLRIFFSAGVLVFLAGASSGQSSISDVKREWLAATDGVLSNGRYHYRFTLTKLECEDLEAKGRYIAVPGIRCEIGRAGERLRFHAKWSGDRSMEKVFDGTAAYITGSNGNHSVFSSSHAKAELLEKTLPSVDPLSDVLGLPVLTTSPENSVPRSIEADFSLDAAFQNEYQIDGETDSDVVLSIPGKDRLTLSKRHGYQVASREWAAGSEKVSITNKGWQSLGDCWCPLESTLTFSGLGGGADLTVVISFEVLDSLQDSDFRVDAFGGQTVSLFQPETVSFQPEVVAASGDSPATKPGLATLNAGQSFSLRSVATGEVDLNALHLGNTGTVDEESLRVPIRPVIWVNMAVFALVAADFFRRRRKGAKPA